MTAGPFHELDLMQSRILQPVVSLSNRMIYSTDSK